MELDKVRLAKLLSMTGSHHDGEVLTAIRKSNELLKLHRTNWSDVLGVAEPAIGEADRPGPAKPATRSEPAAAADHMAWQPVMPAGYEHAARYRSAFRKEPLLPRLLGFPFWIVVEVLAFAAPRMYLNTSGPMITAVFTISMVVGILSWIGLGYFLVFEV